jgi:hypothetical protein
VGLSSTGLSSEKALNQTLMAEKRKTSKNSQGVGPKKQNSHPFWAAIA